MNPDLWLLQMVLLWKQEGRESIGENKAFKFVYNILIFNMLEIPSIPKALDLWNYLNKGINYIIPLGVHLRLDWS